MDFKILDASAFYAGVVFGVNSNNNEENSLYTTTSAVYDEIKHIKERQGVLNTMIETNKLQIREPDTQSIQKVIEAAKKTGDYPQLSKQDISVLALSSQTQGKIITDDFAVSNVAKYLKIMVHPIMTLGIRYEGVWMHYCPGCRKNFKNKVECPLCGTPLKRKLLKRSKDDKNR